MTAKTKWAIFTELESGLQLVLCPIGHWEVAGICTKPLLFGSEDAAMAKASELNPSTGETYAKVWQEQEFEGF